MVSIKNANPNTCGADCQMCCHLIGVTELDKLRLQWCKHCVQGKGCGIYEDRPSSCRTYECVWLAGQRLPPDQRPSLALKPSVCGAVCWEMPNGMLLIDLRPDVTVTPDVIKNVIRAVSFQVDVVVRRRARYWVYRDNRIILDVFNDNFDNGVEIKLEVPAREEIAGAITPNILMASPSKLDPPGGSSPSV